jgi:hypothetical protein
MKYVQVRQVERFRMCGVMPSFTHTQLRNNADKDRNNINLKAFWVNFFYCVCISASIV